MSDYKSESSDPSGHSDVEVDIPVSEADKRAHLSAKGQKMADSIAEYFLMSHFFGKASGKKSNFDFWKKDTKKIRELFLTDMQFNLCKGSVQKATQCF